MAGNALRISGEQDVLKLATRSGRYPVTMLCWARIVTDRNTYSAILTVEYGVNHSTEYNELVTDSDGTTLVMCDHGSLWATVGTMGVGTWRKVAMVITAGHVDCYFGTEGTPGVTRTVNASIANVTSVDYQGVGASNYASAEWFNGRLSGVRVWNAALTEAEIEAEFTSATPVRTTDLLGAWLPPTVEVGTVLTAIAGADLVDGNGGGIPDYTVEDGPTLDAASADVIAARSVQLAGAAGFLPRASAVTARPATVSGVAALSPSPAGITLRTAGLSGAGVIVPSSVAVASSRASLAAFSLFVCASGRVVAASASCSGAAALSASSAATWSRSSQLSGAGSFSPAATAVASTPAALQGSASLSAAGSGVASRSCAATGTANLSAYASGIASAAVAISAVASFSVAPSAISSQGAGFGAAASVSWSPAATIAVGAMLSGVADFAPSSPSEDGSVARGAELSGAGAFEPSSATVVASGVALLGSASFAAGSASVAAASSDCSGTASLVAGAACLRVASVSFAGTGRLHPVTAAESVSPVIIVWVDATLRDPSTELTLLRPATFDVALLDPSVTLDLRPAAAVA